MGQKLLRCCFIVASATLGLGCKGVLQESESNSLDDLLVEEPGESLDTDIDDIAVLTKGRANSATLALELLIAQRRNRTPIPEELSDHEVDVLIQSIKANQIKFGIHATNLANVDTMGFKRSRCILEEQVLPVDEASSSVTKVIGDGLRVSTIKLDLAQGEFRQTGNSLDVGIEGDGFFQFQNDVLGIRRPCPFQPSTTETVSGC